MWRELEAYCRFNSFELVHCFVDTGQSAFGTSFQEPPAGANFLLRLGNLDLGVKIASCRNRTCRSTHQYQLLTRPDTQIDSQKIRSDAMLIELMRRWPRLNGEIQRALLQLVDGYFKGQGT